MKKIIEFRHSITDFVLFSTVKGRLLQGIRSKNPLEKTFVILILNIRNN